MNQLRMSLKRRGQRLQRKNKLRRKQKQSKKEQRKRKDNQLKRQRKLKRKQEKPRRKQEKLKRLQRRRHVRRKRQGRQHESLHVLLPKCLQMSHLLRRNLQLTQNQLQQLNLSVILEAHGLAAQLRKSLLSIRRTNGISNCVSTLYQRGKQGQGFTLESVVKSSLIHREQSHSIARMKSGA